MKRIKVSFFMLFFLCYGFIANAQESKFKALFIYKFAEYIEWSSNPSKIIVGVAGNSDVKAQLSGFADNKDNMEVIDINNSTDASKCNIIFLPKSMEKQLPSFVEMAQSGSVLIVSDDSELVSEGADIGFYLEDGKLRFVINPKSIKSKNMMPSSKLLALGKSI